MDPLLYGVRFQFSMTKTVLSIVFMVTIMITAAIAGTNYLLPSADASKSKGTPLLETGS